MATPTQPTTPHRAPSLKGFTLIEMLVTMAILGVITATTLANFRGGRSNEELRIGSQVLASSIRRAQTLAAGGQVAQWCVGGTNANKLCPNGTAAECPSGACTTDVPKGYGVRFVTAAAGNTRMILFADVNGNRAYDVGEAMRTDAFGATNNVRVSALSPAASGVLDVVFAPPKPTVWLNAASTGAVATVTLQHSQATASTRTVTINSLTGQVSTQ